MLVLVLDDLVDGDRLLRHLLRDERLLRECRDRRHDRLQSSRLQLPVSGPHYWSSLFLQTNPLTFRRSQGSQSPCSSDCLPSPLQSTS